jgi:NAD(P)-dependent dehydrogenase (short-subunit alcohol dehydrogenase family)
LSGANGGLGLETARELARRGARVLMTVRSMDKGEAAAAAIRTEIPAASLEVLRLDLASLDSIRVCADELVAAGRPIDVLVNNAGVMAVPHALTPDGFEMQFGVNHLGHFALTARLFPLLLAAQSPRVVCVSSSARLYGRPVDRSDVNLEQGYGAWHAYGRSKLANAHFALELDARARSAGLRLRAFAADPGFAATDLQAQSARASGERAQRLVHRLVVAAGTSPLQGALPQLRAATDPDARGGSVYALRWLVRGAPVPVRLAARERDTSARAALWRLSEQLTGVTLDLQAAAATGTSATPGTAPVPGHSR